MEFLLPLFPLQLHFWVSVHILSPLTETFPNIHTTCQALKLFYLLNYFFCLSLCTKVYGLWGQHTCQLCSLLYSQHLEESLVQTKQAVVTWLMTLFKVKLKPDPSQSTDGNIKWCSHFGKKSGSSSKVTIELPYPMKQQFHSKVHTQEK